MHAAHPIRNRVGLFRAGTPLFGCDEPRTLRPLRQSKTCAAHTRRRRNDLGIFAHQPAGTACPQRPEQRASTAHDGSTQVDRSWRGNEHGRNDRSGSCHRLHRHRSASAHCHCWWQGLEHRGRDAGLCPAWIGRSTDLERRAMRGPLVPPSSCAGVARRGLKVRRNAAIRAAVAESCDGAAKASQRARQRPRQAQLPFASPRRHPVRPRRTHRIGGHRWTTHPQVSRALG